MTLQSLKKSAISLLSLKKTSGRNILMLSAALVSLLLYFFGTAGFSTYQYAASVSTVAVTGFDVMARGIMRIVGDTSGVKTDYVFGSLFAVISLVYTLCTAAVLAFAVYVVIAAAKKKKASPLPLLFPGLAGLVLAAIALYCQLFNGNEISTVMTGGARFETGFCLVFIPVMQLAAFFTAYFAEFGFGALMTENTDETRQTEKKKTRGLSTENRKIIENKSSSEENHENETGKLSEITGIEVSQSDGYSAGKADPGVVFAEANESAVLSEKAKDGEKETAVSFDTKKESGDKPGEGSCASSAGDGGLHDHGAAGAGNDTLTEDTSAKSLPARPRYKDFAEKQDDLSFEEEGEIIEKQLGKNQSGKYKNKKKRRNANR
jgi:ABC-type multidrug transport system fused ATPase/permease subunit